MANYSGAEVKVIVNDVSVKASSVSGSLANEVKTFIATLTDNTIISINTVMLDRTRVAYIVTYM
jgi:hypothetical protein|tara:strand:- start:1257 stop:1448 length:192 start_codon:yes stop_codon:yes gene_type:complete